MGPSIATAAGALCSWIGLLVLAHQVPPQSLGLGPLLQGADGATTLAMGAALVFAGLAMIFRIAPAAAAVLLGCWSLLPLAAMAAEGVSLYRGDNPLLLTAPGLAAVLALLAFGASAAVAVLAPAAAHARPKVGSDHCACCRSAGNVPPAAGTRPAPDEAARPPAANKWLRAPSPPLVVGRRAPPGDEHAVGYAITPNDAEDTGAGVATFANTVGHNGLGQVRGKARRDANAARRDTAPAGVERGGQQQDTHHKSPPRADHQTKERPTESENPWLRLFDAAPLVHSTRSESKVHVKNAGDESD